MSSTPNIRCIWGSMYQILGRTCSFPRSTIRFRLESPSVGPITTCSAFDLILGRRTVFWLFFLPFLTLFSPFSGSFLALFHLLFWLFFHLFLALFWLFFTFFSGSFFTFFWLFFHLFLALFSPSFLAHTVLSSGTHTSLSLS